MDKKCELKSCNKELKTKRSRFCSNKCRLIAWAKKEEAKMKRKSFLLIFMLLSTPALADIDLDAIIQIESSSNQYAYNKKSGAIGLCQITQPALDDWNRLNKDQYSMTDMFDPQINMRVAYWYLNTRIPAMLKYYKKPINLESVLHSYNAGIGNYLKNIKPLETINYIAKYRRLTNV